MDIEDSTNLRVTDLRNTTRIILVNTDSIVNSNTEGLKVTPASTSMGSKAALWVTHANTYMRHSLKAFGFLTVKWSV